MVAVHKFLGVLVMLVALSTTLLAAETADTTPLGQSVADQLKDATSADGAFIAVGLFREDYKGDSLAASLLYPTDEVVVVGLRGAQVKQALERAVSLYPHPFRRDASRFWVRRSPSRQAPNRVSESRA